jgi:hypothetical protein
VTGTIASRWIAAQSHSQPLATSDRANAVAAPNPACSHPDALGIFRVVEIDTATGPGFGFVPP